MEMKMKLSPTKEKQVSNRISYKKKLAIFYEKIGRNTEFKLNNNNFK